MINPINSLTILLLLSFPSMGQVDLTKYAADDVYKISPALSDSSMSTEKFDHQIRADISEGIRLLEKNEFDKALVVLKRHASNQQTPEVSYLVGRVFFQQKRLDSSLLYMNKALAIDSTFGRAIYYKSLIIFQQNKPVKAYGLLNQLVEIPGQQALGYFGKATLGLFEERFFRSVVNLQYTLQADSSFYDAYLPLAKLYWLYNENRTKALKVVDEAISRKPKWQEAYMLRCLLSSDKEENLSEIQKQITFLIGMDPENGHYLALKGYLNLENGDHELALSDFKTAIELEKTASDNSAVFKSVLPTDLITQSAFSYRDRWTNPDLTTRNLYDLSLCAYLALDNFQAIQLLSKNSGLSKDPSINFLKGVIYHSELTKRQQSIGYYTKAINGDSSLSQAYVNRGIQHVMDSSYEKAISDFSVVITLDRNHRDAFVMRALAYEKTNRYSQAYKDYSAAMSLDLTDKSIQLNRGRVAFFAGNFNLAILDLNNYVSSTRHDPEAHKYLYLSYLNLGDSAKARMSIAEAVQLAPESKFYQTQLLALSTKLKDHEATIKSSSALIKMDKKFSDLKKIRGKTYLELGNFQAAMEDLRAYIKVTRTDCEAYQLLAQAYQSTNQKDDLQSVLQKAKKLGCE